jgi:hypothetical protein
VRKLAPFAAGVVLAFAVVALVRVTEASGAAAYLLIGFAAGVLLIAGLLFAFAGSFSEPRQIQPEALRAMEPNEPAVHAAELDNEVPTAHRQIVVVVNRLQKNTLGGRRPDVAPANGTITARAQPI